MADFETAFSKVLRKEGGYVNNPKDPGGETYKGVARNIHSKWDGWPIIDALKRQSGFPGNLEGSTELQTKISTLYRSNYWDRLQADNITNQQVAFCLFDFGVNAGPATSTLLAQRVVEENPDGIMGTNTVAKINAADPEFFLAAFTVAKIARYITIVNKRPASKDFFFGWVSRAINN
jgi:lysozyme family protein